ncbi:MAG: radical SAM protein [Coriobacteriales bacterium]|nr:radical SAM protein [Coriobacteriales bacterium]
MAFLKEITREVCQDSVQANARATTSCSLGNISAKHPCFAMGKPNNKGRIHLPVSPGCNIACRFCERSINRGEQRPGVTAEVLKPLEALDIVEEALKYSPELSVVGIAGPGDTLATPTAFKTFRLVKEHFPQMVRCMSTNGLLLADKIDELVEVGVDTLTVTVNEVNPKRLSRINDRIVYHGRIHTGIEAAEILIANQLAGIRAAAERGLLIKVNSVLIPGINAEYIGNIARTVKEAGAGLYNIIPLIPNAKMANVPAPTCAQIDRARADAEKHITVFRHCQHCRADAIGIIGGKDYAEEIYRNRPRHENTFSHG